MMMMLFMSIYGVVDGLFVSNFVGKTPFASINLIMPFIMILGGIGFMVGTGGTALVTKLLGEGEKEKANKTFSMMVIFTVISGLIVTGAGIALMRPVAYLLGATEDMIDYCVLYGTIVNSFVTVFMLQNVAQSFLAAAEKPKLGLIITLAAGCTNIVLDALFIVVFKWGLVGAAVATGIGQSVGGLVPMVYFMCPNSSLLRLTKTGLSFKPILQACINGSSELMNSVSSSVVGMLYNLQLMKFLGENGVSAYGVLMYVQFAFIAMEIGYCVGCAPVIGYNYGAQNHGELRNVFKKSMLLMGCAGVVLTGLAQALAVPLGKLFVGYDPELFELTVYSFRLCSFCFLLSGISIFASGFFTALNNGAVSAAISFMRSLVFQASCVLIMPLIFGVNGVWFAITAAETLACVVSISFIVANRKKYHYGRE